MGLITDFPEDQDYYDTFHVNEKELEALRELAEAVKKDEARQPWFVVEALNKLDEARRG